MAVTFLAVANNSASTLAKAATAGATEVELIAGGHTSFPAAVPFDVTIDNEILHVTKVTGDVFTVTRAAQSTTAAEHLTGAQCQLNVTAKSVSDLNEAVNNIETGTTDLTSYAKLVGRKNEQRLSGGKETAGFLELRAWEGVGVAGKVVLRETGLTVEGECAVNGALKVGTVEATTIKVEKGSEIATGGGFLFGRMALGPGHTPLIITSDRPDYAAMKKFALWERLSAETEARKIHGISTVELLEGEVYTLTNVGSFNIVLMNESATCPTEAHRFKLPKAEVVIAPDQSVLIVYDETSKRWRALTAPGP